MAKKLTTNFMLHAFVEVMFVRSYCCQNLLTTALFGNEIFSWVFYLQRTFWTSSIRRCWRWKPLEVLYPSKALWWSSFRRRPSSSFIHGRLLEGVLSIENIWRSSWRTYIQSENLRGHLSTEDFLNVFYILKTFWRTSIYKGPYRGRLFIEDLIEVIDS